MRSFASRIKALVARRDRGATAAEYALIVAAVVAVVAAIVISLGNVVQEQFTDTCEAVNNTASTGRSCTGGSQ